MSGTKRIEDSYIKKVYELKLKEKRFIAGYVQKLISGNLALNDKIELINLYDHTEKQPMVKYNRLIKKKVYKIWS